MFNSVIKFIHEDIKLNHSDIQWKKYNEINAVEDTLIIQLKCSRVSQLQYQIVRFASFVRSCYTCHCFQKISFAS